jgi:heme iron utilization protein
MTNVDVTSARSLVKAGKFGALATIARDGGHPFATLVGYALAGAAPVFLLSELAEHTRNVRADGRASLLVVDGSADEPLAHGRVTVVGRLSEDPTADVQADYLAVHPGAEAYLAMKDFRFWRMAVESVRYVGGFGKMGWIDGEAWAAEP